MRFRLSSRPPGYLDRQLQRRLWACVAIAAVALVVFGAFQAYRPGQPHAAGQPLSVSPDQIDFTVDAGKGGSLRDGDFRAPRSSSSRAAPHNSARGANGTADV